MPSRLSSRSALGREGRIALLPETVQAPPTQDFYFSFSVILMLRKMC